MSDTLTARYKISPHARKRRKQMHVTEDQIALTLADPDCVYPCDRRKYPPSRNSYQRGELVIIADDADREVITVLWHRREGRE